MRVVRRVSSLLLAAGAVAAVGGCTRSVGVDLAVVEPCDQQGLAINSVRSFLLKSSGSTDPAENGAASFPAGSDASVAVGLGAAVTMTLAGYGSDITVSSTPLEPTEAPIAIGRTMPLAITEETTSVDATILVGRVDSFGGPRSADGTCAVLGTAEGSTIAGRHGHTATFVPGVNKVLIVGGAVFNADGSETFLGSVDLFDPATNTIEALPALRPPRAYHTAVALANGKVVITGGFSAINTTTSAIVNGAVIDVAADGVTTTFQLNEPRAHHTATLLEDVNRLILIGGCNGVDCKPDRAAGTSTTFRTNPVEIIDTTTFKPVAGLPIGLLNTPRAMHEAIGFESGNRGFVVVSGGLNGTGALDSIEILQLQSTGSPIINQATTQKLPTPLVRHQMTRDGVQFIITGGQASAPGGILSDAIEGSAAATLCGTTDGITCFSGVLNDMLAPRFGHHAILLTDQQLLVVGGFVPAGLPASERFNRGAQPNWSPTSSSGRQVTPRLRGAVTMLGGAVGKGAVNEVLYTGGHSAVQPYQTSSAIDLYFGR